MSSLAPVMPLVILLYSAMVPLEVRFDIGDQTIYPYRAVFLLMIPWLVNRVISGVIRLRLADYLIAAGCAWIFVSFMNRYGFSEGLLRGGGLVIDIIGPYFVARYSVRSATDLRRVLVLIAPGLFISAFSMMMESVTHVAFVRPAFAAVFGNLPAYENGVAIGTAAGFTDVRLGLLRASGPFAHPILAGLFLSSMLSFYLMSGVRGWPRIAGVVAGLLSFFSISSAAILSMLLSFIGVGYEAIQRRTDLLTWRGFVIMSVVGAGLVQFLSQGGLVALMIRMSLNPQTGYYRRQIWDYGSASVMKHPWFGIGFDAYERARWMNASVDNFWLVLGIRHGFITPICFLLAAIAAATAVALASIRYTEIDRRLLAAVSIAIVVLSLMGFTVAFFGGMTTWYFGVIAIAVSLAGGRAAPSTAAGYRVAPRVR